MKIVGCYTLYNWGGYEIAEDEFSNLFYRWNDGEHVGEWEEMEVLENFDDGGKTWVYNPDQQAFLFPIEEIMKVW